ncbi:MAG: DnaJ domain-containing protein [Deltaproteobacteria bacterium]|nr:DnaJ domain-containing protein [Deltaproteobacteria bacterium]
MMSLSMALRKRAPLHHQPIKMMPMNDYYQVLGVSKDAPSQKIKAAYREKAFLYHPDRCKDPAGADQMKAVNEAYAVLSDLQKRKEYDLMQQQYGDGAYGHFRKSYSEQDIFKGSDIQQIFEEMARGFGIRGFDAIFKEYYGQNYKTFELKRPGLNIQGFFFSGVREMPLLNKQSIKEKIGNISQQLLQKATTGRPQKGADYHDVIRIDPSLADNGGPYAYHLLAYGRKLVVKIPPGTREGQKIRLAGMGEEGKNGMPSGDLFLKVTLRKSLFERIKAMLPLKSKKS